MTVELDSRQKARFAVSLEAGLVEASAGGRQSFTGQKHLLLTALSGGSDSTALALLTEQYARQRDILHRTIIVDHGSVKSNCFIIDKKLAYITDVSDIYKKDYSYFKNLKYLIIDCLWYNFHPSHFNLETSLGLIKQFKPKRAILTNLSPVLDYKVLKKMLPKNVIPAHDGLSINL